MFGGECEMAVSLTATVSGLSEMMTRYNVASKTFLLTVTWALYMLGFPLLLHIFTSHFLSFLLTWEGFDMVALLGFLLWQGFLHPIHLYHRCDFY